MANLKPPPTPFNVQHSEVQDHRGERGFEVRDGRGGGATLGLPAD